MTNTDLRIKYKFDTGLYPTKMDYRGNLTQEYAKWLEEYGGDYPPLYLTTWQREYFKKETGNYATFYKKGRIHYKRDYRFWLEDFVRKILSLEQ